MLPLIVLAIIFLVVILLAAPWSIPGPPKGGINQEQEWDDTDFIEPPDSRAAHPSQGEPHALPPEPEPISDEEFELEVAVLLAPPVVQALWTPDEIEATREDLGDDPETHRQVQDVLAAIEDMEPEAPAIVEAPVEEPPAPMVWKKWNK